MAARAGFLVKNAADVGSNLDVAEPDALDFNLLGSQRYGVITGCDVSVTGSSWVVNVTNGVYGIKGVAVAGGGQVTLPTASQDLRFDLIVGDAAGHVSAIVGTASPNPIFPACPDDVCVFAAVLVRPGVMPQPADVTDKRIMLMQSFITAINDGAPLLRNSDPSTLATLFQIDPFGLMTFIAQGGSVATLGGDSTVASGLVVNGAMRVTGALLVAAMTVASLTSTGKISGSNFHEGPTAPTVGPVTGVNGDIYKNTTDGSVWVYQAGTWAQVSTAVVPPGFTMMGFLSTAPPGWLLVNGQTISMSDAGGLWNARPDWRIDASNMRLPDARDCFFAWGNPGVKAGNPTALVPITTANMPPHHHLVSPTTDAGGSHAHGATATADGYHAHTTQGLQGAHVHDVYDPGHVHPPPPGGGGPPAIPIRVFSAPAGFALGDQPIVLAPSTGAAATGIAITTGSSNHVHSTDLQGQHGHTISVATGGSAHSHPINESTIGGGQPLDVRPPFMGMYLYVKT